MITQAQVKKFCPTAKAPLVSAIVSNWSDAEEAGITTGLRISHFMAQIATETRGLQSVEEGLNYTSTKRLMEVWPTRFKTAAQAQPFIRNPKELAIKVYGGRMGNGISPSTDGWDYRGGGMLQTTGREGYRKMGFETNPDALRDPVIAFKTAVREWANRGCNAVADRDDVTAIRKAINGGTNGLTDAKSYLKAAKAIFKDAPVLADVAKPARVTLFSKPAAPKDDKLIENVQQLLRDKGYPEVGDPDNRMGTRTRNAILAFEADNAMPLTGKVSDELLAALVKAPVRQNSAARTTATASDLKEKNIPTVKAGDQLQKLGKGILTTMGVGAVGQGALDFDSIKGRLDSMRGVYDTVMSFSPWIVGAAVAGVAIFFGIKVVESQVQAYRQGHSV